MPTKLILNRDVEKLGSAGDVVEVKDGYARNYLLPRGYAVRWTKGAQRHIDREVERMRKSEIASVEEAIALRDRMAENPVVELEAKAGSTGRLFGSITGRQIGIALTEAYGMPFDPRSIDFDGPIKRTGTYDAKVKILSDVVANVEVKVVALEQ